MIHISHILKSVLQTITDEHLLSSRPHHIECTTCKGEGGFFNEVTRNYEDAQPCEDCNGTGTIISSQQ